MTRSPAPLPAFPPLPATPTLDGRLLRGRWAGTLRDDPVAHGPRTGRVRRWMYAAAGAGELALGAAIVDLGIVAVAFAWLRCGSVLHRYDARRMLGRSVTVGRVPAEGASMRTSDALVQLAGDGSMHLDVPTPAGRIRAELAAAGVTPLVLVTGTPDGGWNATQKAAGYTVDGTAAFGGQQWPLQGAVGWRDWTVGRQDRQTSWRWAAGGGITAHGVVGFNVSTGMNACAAGEDVIWWDGVPAAITVERLAPVGDGDWEFGGGAWSMALRTAAVRAADEHVGPLRSAYVQPIGVFAGTLPGPDGRIVAVDGLSGVAEDHEARW